MSIGHSVYRLQAMRRHNIGDESHSPRFATDKVDTGDISDMNRALRNRFPPFVDKQSLRTAIEQVCAEFGTVTKLEIFPARREQVLQCACFLRLDSDAAVARLKAKCQVHQLGNDIAFFAEVDEGWTGETM